MVDCEQEANTSEITRKNARANNIGRLFIGTSFFILDAGQIKDRLCLLFGTESAPDCKKFITRHYCCQQENECNIERCRMKKRG